MELRASQLIFLFLLFLLFLCLPLVASAQQRDVPESVLIRNVTLVNQAGEAGDIVVSILIKDNKLDVVTQDEVAIDAAKMALDAREGILLGKLELGELANFLILSEDPRKDVQVLLDTATYAAFAVRHGEIVRNRLERAVGAGEKQKRSGWLAYSPPPLMLPTSYQDSTKWNKWDTPYVSGLFLAGMAIDRQNWQSQDSASLTQFGNLSDFDGGEIRAFRFGAVGTLNFPKPWVYTIFAATNAFDKGFDTDQEDDWTFFDWRLDIPTYAGTTLSVGKQKEPISMERVMGGTYLPMQERSAVADALLPARNVGVVLSGTGFDQRITWAGGVFNDWIDTGDSPGDSATQLIGRMTWLPWTSPDESNLVHLGAGFRHSNAKEGIMVATEPEFDQSPVFVDTDFFEADESVTYNVEASWRKGPFWLAGEYVLGSIDAPDLEDPNLTGYHVTASWALTGEMRSYNRKSGVFGGLPVAKTLYQGGRGTWEVAARWSALDARDGLVDGGEMETLSLGLNWWLTPFFTVNFNYRWITLDRFGVEGDSNGFNTRIFLMLE